MRDSRFGYGQRGDRPGFHTTYPRYRTAETLDALYEQWQTDIRDAEVIAGRRDSMGRLIGEPLNRRELWRGVDRPDNRDSRTRRDQEVRRKSELNPPVVDTRSPEQAHADYWADKVREEQEAKLSPTERMAQRTAREAKEAEQRAAENAKRAEIESSKSYQQTREKLDKLLFMGKFDPDLEMSIYEELVHQSELLDRTLDAPAAHKNLQVIQQAVVANKADAELKLTAAMDVAKQQLSTWGDGLAFDRPPLHFMDNGVEMVKLSRNGQSINISRGLFDGRTDEQLRQHFVDLGLEAAA